MMVEAREIPTCFFTTSKGRSQGQNPVTAPRDRV